MTHNSLHFLDPYWRHPRREVYLCWLDEYREELNAELAERMQLLRHESMATTRVYSTPSQQDLQRGVEKVALA